MEGKILRRLQRIWIAALALSVSAWGMAATVAEPISPVGGQDQYRLLRLERQITRWHTDVSGPAVVRYAFLDKERRFPGARNCGGMQPPELLRARSGITHEVLAREMSKAARQWEQVANIRFVEAENENHASLLIGAQTKPTGRAFTNVELSEPAGSAPRSISRALICLNPQMHWKIGFDGDLESYDLRYTLAHELGHAIGLDHPGPTGQLMGFRYTEAFDTLQPGDIAGAVALYGKPVPSVAQAVAARVAPHDALTRHDGNDMPQARAQSLALGETGVGR
ncbi:MAG: matrixin family metalloprotease [Hyphomicrobiaceae bacterium]